MPANVNGASTLNPFRQIAEFCPDRPGPPADRFKKNILSRKRGDLFLPESYIGWKEKIAAREQHLPPG
jgi:hypothetical protein